MILRNKNRRTRAVLWLLPAFLLIVWASPAPADLNITFTKIADTSTPIPFGTGNFTGFGVLPSIDDNGDVVFCGFGNIGQEGIYTHIGGTLGRVADKNTPIPGRGEATFTRFICSDKHSIDNGKVAFQADITTPGSVFNISGMYTNAGGSLVEIGIADNTLGNFTGFFSFPWLSGSTVAFSGTEVTLSGSTENKIFKFDSTTNTLTEVPATDASCPTCGVIGSIPSLDGNAVAFVRGTTRPSELVIVDGGGAIETVVSLNNTPQPSQPGNVFTRVDGFPALDGNGADIAFGAAGRNFSKPVDPGIVGVYKRLGGSAGSIARVADTTTVIPDGPLGGSTTFTNVSDRGVSLAGSSVAFLGFAGGASGIYTDIGGTLNAVVDTNIDKMITVDGVDFKVSFLSFSSEGLGLTPTGHSLVFLANLTPIGGFPRAAIVRADITAGAAPAIIAVNESITVTDAPQVTPPAVINLAETINVTDAPVLLPAALINVAEAITVTDESALLPSVLITVAEAITVNDVPTIANTVTGTDVAVLPVDATTGTTPVSLTFSEVTNPGTTSLTTTSSGPPPPSGFRVGSPPIFYDLTTTALFTGSVEVCIDYSGTAFRNESRIRLFHFKDGDWVDSTSSLNTVNNIICASVTSLSLFAIFEPDNRPVIAVTNRNDDSVSLIDPETNEAVGTVDVGKKPVAGSFFDVPFGEFTPPARLYVADRNDDTVSVLTGPTEPTSDNAFDFALSNTINVKDKPEGLRVNPDGGQVWAVSRNDDSISIIDRATGNVIATVGLSKKKGSSEDKDEDETGRKTVAIAFSPDGQFAYVAGRNSDNLIVLDTGKAVTEPDNAVVASFEVGKKPEALAVHPTEGLVYVVNRSGNEAAVVDVSDPTAPVILAQVPVGEEPEGIAILPDGSKLYVTNSESNTVSVLDLQSDPTSPSLVATVPVGQEPSAIAATRPGSFADGDLVYVANREDNTVSVIDTNSDEVIATIHVGKGPKGVAAGLLPTGP